VACHEVLLLADRIEEPERVRAEGEQPERHQGEQRERAAESDR